MNGSGPRTRQQPKSCGSIKKDWIRLKVTCSSVLKIQITVSNIHILSNKMAGSSSAFEMIDLERGEVQEDSGTRESPEYVLVHSAGEEELTTTWDSQGHPRNCRSRESRRPRSCPDDIQPSRARSTRPSGGNGPRPQPYNVPRVPPSCVYLSDVRELGS